MNASVTLSLPRAFPVLLTLALAGFVQPQQASAQSLVGTWQFDVYENASGDLVDSETVVIDRKAKSFRISNRISDRSAQLTALKINPSKGTFKGAFLEASVQSGYEGWILVGIAETDQGLIIGEAESVRGVFSPGLPLVVPLGTYTFIGVKID